MYMKLEKEDWDALSHLASEIAAILMADMEAGVDPDRPSSFEETELFAKMQDQIEFMELKYGPHPIILDTKADFADDVDEQIRLKHEAIAYCFPEDHELRGNILRELAELYFEEKNDSVKADGAIEAAIKDLENADDPQVLRTAKEMKDKISGAR